MIDIMQRTFTVFFMTFCLCLNIHAQVPFFAKTVGQDKMYAYTSIKVRPGINAQETYTTFMQWLKDFHHSDSVLLWNKNDKKPALVYWWHRFVYFPMHKIQKILGFKK